MLFVRLIFLLTFVGIYGHSWSQEATIYQRLQNLNFVDQLPKDILSAKTVVLVRTKNKHHSYETRTQWKDQMEPVQRGFKKAGIDAVAYYHFDDILSGQESYNNYLDAFDDRNLSHAVFLTYDGTTYQLIFLKLQDRQYLIADGQDAWKMEGTNINEMMRDLYRKTANSGLESTNLLIIGTPEFAPLVNTLAGKRSEFYDLNFKSEKLAVPMFADTAIISQVMANYPYKWGFVDPSLDEKEIRKQGFQYILYYVHSTVHSVRHMLEYPIEPGETAFISEVKTGGQSQVESQALNAMVYKFYVKHIYSKNSFVGKRWDAGYSWQSALSNYIVNLRNELVRD